MHGYSNIYLHHSVARQEMVMTTINHYFNRNINTIDSMRWFYQRRSPTPQFCWGGGAHPEGLRATNLNSAEIFAQCTHLTPSFIILDVHSFGSYRVDRQTDRQPNQQTPLKTSNVLRHATTLGNQMGQPSIAAVRDSARKRTQKQKAIASVLLINTGAET